MLCVYDRSGLILLLLVAFSQSRGLGGCAEEMDALGGRGCLRTPTGPCGCVNTMSNLSCCIPRLPAGGSCPCSLQQRAGSAIDLPRGPKWHRGRFLNPMCQRLERWMDGLRVWKARNNWIEKSPPLPISIRTLVLSRNGGDSLWEGSPPCSQVLPHLNIVSFLLH